MAAVRLTRAKYKEPARPGKGLLVDEVGAAQRMVAEAVVRAVRAEMPRVQALESAALVSRHGSQALLSKEPKAEPADIT